MNSRAGRSKLGLIILSLLSVALCYADRVIMSVAIIPLSQEFDLDKGTQGVILSSFFVGYILTQIIGGRAADRYGGFIVLATCVFLWSLFTLLTPIAALGGVALLIFVRILMGAGEGGAFPSIWSLYARQLPLEQRARAITATMSGVPVGTLIALISTPVIIAAFGWEAPFYLFGGLGIVWCLFWSMTFLRPGSRSQREEHKRQVDDAAPLEQTRPANFPDLLRNRAVLAIVVAHFSANWTSYVLMTWLPTFVAESFEVNFAQVGLWASLPAVAAIIFMNLSGLLADKMLLRGMDTTRVRKLMTSLGFLGSALALSCVGLADSALSAISIMCLGTALGSLAVAGFAVNHTDIAPNDSGTVMGITNTAGTLPGIIGVFITGLLLELTESWALVFGLAAAVSIAGMLVYLRWGSAERQF